MQVAYGVLTVSGLSLLLAAWGVRRSILRRAAAEGIGIESLPLWGAPTGRLETRSESVTTGALKSQVSVDGSLLPWLSTRLSIFRALGTLALANYLVLLALVLLNAVSRWQG